MRSFVEMFLHPCDDATMVEGAQEQGLRGYEEVFRVVEFRPDTEAAAEERPEGVEDGLQGAGQLWVLRRRE